jgi:outer membrane protein assembly factor BamB
VELTEAYEIPTPAIAGEIVCSVSCHAVDDRQELRGFALDTGQLLWRAYTDYDIYGSPAVADGIVLIGDTRGTCYAIRAADGSELWSAKLAEDLIETAPAIAGGTAFVASMDGMVHAVDLDMGKKRWPAVLGTKMPWLVAVSAGNAATERTGAREEGLAASSETLLAGSGDWLLGIDTRIGERRWRRRLSSRLRGTLAIGNGAVVACGESTVHAVAITDGRVRWERSLEGQLTSPSIAGNVIFVASQQPALLHALSLHDGHELWNVTHPGWVTGSPVIVPGKVFLTADEAISVLRFDEATRRPKPD